MPTRESKPVEPSLQPAGSGVGSSLAGGVMNFACVGRTPRLMGNLALKKDQMTERKILFMLRSNKLNGSDRSIHVLPQLERAWHSVRQAP